MRQIFKIEINRAMKGWGMRLSLLIGFSVSIAHVIQYVIPLYQSNLTRFYEEAPIVSPHTVAENWLAGNAGSLEAFIYFLLIPLLAALPFGASYFDDNKSGFLKNIYMRSSRKQYLSAKYIAAFLSGGTAVVIPLAVNVMCCLCLLPNLQPVAAMGFNGINPQDLFCDIFFSRPLGYLFIFLFIDFLMGGIWACVGLTGSFLSDYKIIVLICPFFVQLVIHVLCTILNQTDYSSVYWTMSGSGIIRWWIPVVYLTVGIIATLLIFRNRGEMEDVF